MNKEGLQSIELLNDTGSALVVGQPMFYKGRIVLSKNALANGSIGPFLWRGQVEMPKNTSTAFTKGQVVFWDIADGELNADAGNPLAGRVIQAVGASTATAIIDFGEGLFDSRKLIALKNDSGADLAQGAVLKTQAGQIYSRIYVASEAVVNSATGNFYADLVVTLPKLSSVAMARGVIVSWDHTNSHLTTVTYTAGHSTAGRVIVAEDSASLTVKIDIADRG
ncbi:MAG: DUF2190 family protein [Patescibacteria group bacterium]